MNKIESYSIEMRPFDGTCNDVYQVKVRVNGMIYSVTNAVAPFVPHEAEMHVLHSMGMKIIEGLRDEEKHGGCCDCCEKKNKCGS